MKHYSLASILLFVKTNETLLASIVLVLGIIIATVTFLVPNLKKVQVIVSEKQLLDERYAVLKRKDSQLISMSDRTYVQFLQRIERIIPQSKDFVSLFSTFDSLEQKTNVTISQTEFQFGVVSTNSAQLIKSSVAGAYVVPFRAVVNASLEQIPVFLDTLSDLSGRYFTVEDVQWSFTDGTLVKMNLSGQAYFLPASGKIGAIDAPIPALTVVQQKMFDTILALAVPETELAVGEPFELGKENLFE